MSLLTKPLSAGDLRGTIYTFENVGDVLPMHSHSDDDVHITIVARGRVSVIEKGKEPVEYGPGVVIDNDAPITHEIVAVKRNSRIVNIIKRAPRG